MMKSFLLIVSVFTFAYGSSPVVVTDEVRIEGTTYTLPNGRVVDAFLGMPFAEPPVGNNRFEPPQPKRNWFGTWNATFSRSACVQFFATKEVNKGVTGEEDCLYLNVFRPRKIQSGNENSLLNVLVYVHGGGFMFGNGRNIHPDYILEKDDIVFVSISYRLGPLGFFSANDLVAPGNYGLKDQVAALQWVQRNIRYFGGNPGEVTIYGISAGAASVHYHLLSPLSNGLFQKAASASGSALLPWSLLPSVLKNSFELASTLKCPTNDVQLMMRCLKRKPVEEIFEASIHLKKSKNDFVTFGPVVEPQSRIAFLSKNPLNLLKSGKVKQIPWLVSVVETEGSVGRIGLIVDDEQLKEVNDHWYEISPYIFVYDHLRSKPERDHISSALRKYYFNDQPISRQNDKVLLQAIGDRFFYNGVPEAVNLHTSAVLENTIYCYKLFYRGSVSVCDRFSRNSKNYGVCHFDDQFYLVDLFGMKPKLSKPDVEMSKFMTSRIVAFMKTGNPNIGDATWKPVTKGNGMNCLNIYSPTFQKMENIENATTIEFWKNLLPFEHREDPS